MTDMVERVAEAEWTNQFGTHREFRAVAKDGSVCSKVVTKHPWGWSGLERSRADVRQEVERIDAALGAKP